MRVVKHDEQTIEAADGTPLHVERWEPRGPVRFVVVIAHGGAEHVARYERLARMFGEHGGLCFGPDHRGQGKSGGRPGHVASFEQYADDLRRVIEGVAATLPAAERPDALPWFVFGHSMGGLITLTYLLDHADAVPLRGVVLSSPLLEVAVKLGALKRGLAAVVTPIMPTLSVPAGIPPEHICRDPDEVGRYERDPRRVRTFTVGWFAAMQRASARVRAAFGSIEVPCLVYVGTGDLICNHRATMDVFAAQPDAGARGHELHCFDGYFHELHNEPAELRAPVMELVEQWVLARAGVQPDD